MTDLLLEIKNNNKVKEREETTLGPALSTPPLHVIVEECKRINHKRCQSDIGALSFEQDGDHAVNWKRVAREDHVNSLASPVAVVTSVLPQLLPVEQTPGFLSPSPSMRTSKSMNNLHHLPDEREQIHRQINGEEIDDVHSWLQVKLSQVAEQVGQWHHKKQMLFLYGTLFGLILSLLITILISPTEHTTIIKQRQVVSLSSLHPYNVLIPFLTFIMTRNASHSLVVMYASKSILALSLKFMLGNSVIVNDNVLLLDMVHGILGLAWGKMLVAAWSIPQLAVDKHKVTVAGYATGAVTFQVLSMMAIGNHVLEFCLRPLAITYASLGLLLLGEQFHVSSIDAVMSDNTGKNICHCVGELVLLFGIVSSCDNVW
eukprot:CAMPEP_0172489964 /NCGR_PEP_ID=MMETSP1066-20121228/20262_1 /TAXON_ID=671091 /ORGANISM="Coscinodiscus wailesii, Strain CCMP2513" /LENGTH=372 /DNA_ID=CAMNT_0013258203 /DNA_START=1 /DNA_END=1116 /DNA_ORIENTATION=-